MNRTISAEAGRATAHLVSSGAAAATGAPPSSPNGVAAASAPAVSDSATAHPAAAAPVATAAAVHAATAPAANGSVGEPIAARLLREVEDLVVGFGEVVRKFRLTPTAATDLEQARRYGEVLSRYVEMVTRLAAPSVAVASGLSTGSLLSGVSVPASSVGTSETEPSRAKPPSPPAAPVAVAAPVGGAAPVTGAAPVVAAAAVSVASVAAPSPSVTISAAPAATAPVVSGVPVSGVPVSGVPVGGVPVSGVPVSGVPVGGVPVGGVPIGAIVAPPPAPVTALGRAIADLRDSDRSDRFGRDRDGYFRDSHRIRSAAATSPEPERRLRDPQEVFADLRAVERELEEASVKSDAELPVDSRLLILKSLACRQRGLFDELQMQRCEDTRAREMYAQLKDNIEKLVARTSDPNQYQYVIPLDTRATPRHPSDWYEAARRYAALPECLAALDWLTGVVSQLSDTDKKEILEPVAARQQRLYRVLQQRFHSAGQEALTDPQQGMLFGRLREYARTHSIFLIGLNGHTEEAELERLANQLPAALERQKTRIRRKQEQEDAVTKVVSTVTGARFGSREQHADMLQVMVRRVLELGVPPQHPPLRDALLDWGHLLGSEEKFVSLLKAIEAEKRRRDSQKALLEEESRETELDAAHGGELARVLPSVAGGRGVLIGGPCREENRAVIVTTLKLTELVWEDTTGRDNAHDFEPLIAGAGVRVVFLMVRMMKPGYGRIAELCRKHGRWLVRLPGGFGINSVVQQMFEQLAAQEPAHPAVGNGLSRESTSPSDSSSAIARPSERELAAPAGSGLSDSSDRSLSGPTDALSAITPLLA